jgi:hypothetical protein
MYCTNHGEVLLITYFYNYTKFFELYYGKIYSLKIICLNNLLLLFLVKYMVTYFRFINILRNMSVLFNDIICTHILFLYSFWHKFIKKYNNLWTEELFIIKHGHDFSNAINHVPKTKFQNKTCVFNERNCVNILKLNNLRKISKVEMFIIQEDFLLYYSII